MMLIPATRTEGQLYGQMFTPAGWSTFVNEGYSQLVQIVNGEVPANASQALSRRFKGLGRRDPYVQSYSSCLPL